ncbi:hypothetical protein N665_0751s0010 [Sinapis alba]|nr:hypothetical protein N665_0751s0010 [Sinapis alba]
MEVIDKLVAEFLIRRQHNPTVSPSNLLSALKFGDSPDCMKLKMFSGTLDLLEILEKLQERSLLTESHKSAYCGTAAECALRFMLPLSASDGLFTDAVERIWTKRIGSRRRVGAVCGFATAVSFLNQLLKEQWALLGSSTLESVAQRRFLKRKAEKNAERDGVRSGGDPSVVDESTRRLESDIIDHANERRGSGEEEDGNGNNEDAEGVGCLENDEERTMGAEEQEHESSLDNGDKTAARELEECMLEIQRQIDPSTSHVQEPKNAIDYSLDVIPQSVRVNKTGTSGQDRLGSRGTCSGRLRPPLPTPVSLKISPLKKPDSSVRGRKKFWTPEVVEALREGEKEYGKSWKDIKNANPAVFAERTEVDLKDKWRNLVR